MAAWLVDGNNVMGARPDGWWRDRRAGMQRVVNTLDDRGEEITVVFDGRPVDLQAARVTVRFAPHADDLLAELAPAFDVVVTSDRALAARCRAAGAAVRGASAVLAP